ncbi:magnesium transporter [Anaerotignum lactatifermentans]|uniref:Magnesium transporter n=1 Tax=Anaerotignum lactatifermentans TaxID=160404 RepID=A0ABS2G8J8_9FIRM|nr:CorA family divalent cation transporter [Anaerotignum lactatifermentans]MBM6829268.1 magnesium transporter [Anaerotignum lactatifermentans]MBM6877492.1 magnesium transporter [Anaerotignum lactatifermentans]MBM6950846.1 magnesium transporter [Anaerotignum lactatifermentans]
MYMIVEEGGYRMEKKVPEAACEIIGVFSYDEMREAAAQWGISLLLLEEARKFGFAKYDSFENFDCISLEMQNYHNIPISHGSVVIYLEKGKACFFTSRKERVLKILRENAESLGEKISWNRLLYLFFEAQTKEEEIAFDAMEKQILHLEQSLITSERRNYVNEIIHLRKNLMMMKRYYEQFLNVLDVMMENENGIFDGKTLRSFKMLSRRTERSYQNILNLREYVTQVRESYEAEVDISLNTTMKIFTVVTTIFLPLTLIAGWYGMNFQMPEYGWKHGYVMVIVLSILFILLGIAFFKKKKWF